MKDYHEILRRVGWVFIIVGLIDIAFMVYCILNKTSYHSNLNIFAVIAGIFLLKGSLKATRIISLFIALFIAGTLGGIVVMPFLSPIDLLLTQVRLYPFSILIGVVNFFVFMAIAVWGYREITSAPVRSAMDESRIDYTSFLKKPALGFWVGGCMAVFMVIPMYLLMNGATATEVKQRAAVQVGNGYKFHIQSMNMSSNASSKSTYAVVTAYNNSQIKNVVVQWSE
jgi:hypothetical protein